MIIVQIEQTKTPSPPMLDATIQVVKVVVVAVIVISLAIDPL